MKKITLLLMLFTLVNSSFGQELFKQDFNSSSTLTDYINLTSPTNGQFNAITVAGTSSATITSNALRFTRGTGTTSFTRSTDFSPSTTAIIYRFDLNISGISSNTNGVARLQIGSNFTTTNNNFESIGTTGDTYAQLELDFRGSLAFRFSQVNGTTFSTGTTHAITWVMNNSGSTITYLAPNGLTETVADDKMDLWVGTNHLYNEVSVEKNTGIIQDMKFAFVSSTGTISMDNMSIYSLNSIPQNAADSFNGNAICNGSNGILTLATSVGTGPFTVVYNDAGTNRYVQGVTSGVPFNTVVNPTATRTYTLVSVSEELSGATRTSGFGDSSATVTVTQSPTANAGTALTTCSNSGSILISTGASATNQASLLWTTSGTGGFSNATSVTTNYTPSAADISAGSVVLTLTAYANTPCSNAVSNKTLTINTQPTASAGTAILTCSSVGAVNITAGSSATNQVSVLWTSNGTGTFANATSLTTATYTPSAADITAGSRILTLTAIANSGCSNVISTKTITIASAPTANAGTALTTCSNSGSILISTGASATNQASLLWTTSGTGGFSNATSVTTNYTPSAADISAGSVVLTLTAYANTPCSNAVSNKTLTINTQPTASAGTAISTCSSVGAVNITAGSSATNQVSVLWTSNGGGSFTNANSLTSCTYTPNPSDIAAGSRILTLTAYASSGCSNVISTKTITITKATTANAGTDVSTCSNSGAVNITAGSSANNESSVLWTSNGSGTFANATSLTMCTYTPSASDILEGSVVLTLTAYANAPCTDVVVTKTLNIHPNPTVTLSYSCSGNDVIFTALPNNSTLYDYTWTLPSLISNTSSSNSLTAQNPGTYTVYITNKITNCSSVVETLTVTFSTLYQDLDGDGYGNPAVSVFGCSQSGYVSNNTDCDDTDDTIYPGAPEICYDGVLQNCNGTLTDGCAPVLVNMISSYCNTVLPFIFSTVTAENPNLPSGTVETGYRFHIKRLYDNEERILDRPIRNFKLTMTDIFEYGTFYQVKVAIKVNTEWQPYGNTCLMATPSIPTTQIVQGQCGTILPLLFSTVTCNTVNSANQYRFRVENSATSEVEFIERPVHNFKLTQLTTYPVQYNTSYNVSAQVRVVIDGAEVWSNSGPICNITTPTFPTTQVQLSQCELMATSNTQVVSLDIFSGTSVYRVRLTNTGLGYMQTVDRTSPNFTLSMFTGLTAGATYTVAVSIKLNGVFGPWGKNCDITTPVSGRPMTKANDNNTKEFSVIAFPNPFATTFALDVKTSSATEVNVSVFDMTGRLLEVRTAKAEDLLDYNLGDRYPSGVYNIVVNQGMEVKTVRVVKQ